MPVNLSQFTVRTGPAPRGPAGAKFPASRPSTYSSRDKKSAAGVVAGLRSKGRDVAFRVGAAKPSGRNRGDFQSVQLPNRARSSSSPSKGILGGFFRRFRKS